ncbi:MAG: hypothetical protein R6X06_09665 [Gammaproteobacteria bacterium]
MSDKPSFSDELLNAYIDGELDIDDRTQILEQMRQDTELNRRVCALKKVRDMVRLAYDDLPVPVTYPSIASPQNHRRYVAMAAGVLMMLGTFTAGWFLHGQQQALSLVELAQEVTHNQTIASDEHWRLVLQLSTDDPFRINVALNEIEQLLVEHRQRQQPVSIELLANGRGLNLLRSDTSPYAERIRALQTQYDNLLFQACGMTLARLQQEKGLMVKLLPDTQVVPSALGQRLKRQKEGWTYIRI